MRAFVDLLVELGADRQGAVDYYLVQVASRYQEAGRHYHTLSHVHACLEVLDAVPIPVALPGTRLAIELALWLHDVSYDTRCKHNEERSARVLLEAAESLNLGPPILIHAAASAILHTKHTGAVPLSTVSKVVVDADLSILGSPPEVFDAYEVTVREEYSWATDEEWRVGRSAFLQKVLTSGRVYNTHEFVMRFEQPALENMRRSLSKLQRGGV